MTSFFVSRKVSGRVIQHQCLGKRVLALWELVQVIT